jgi:hypothetical protein
VSCAQAATTLSREAKHARFTGGERTVRRLDCDHRQPIYSREVVRIARVEGQPVRQGNPAIIAPYARVFAFRPESTQRWRS